MFEKLWLHEKPYWWVRSTCDKIMNTPETVSINSNNKNITYRMNCYILPPISLVTTLLLNIVIICYYCMKHRSKQKGILPGEI